MNFNNDEKDVLFTSLNAIIKDYEVWNRLETKDKYHFLTTYKKIAENNMLLAKSRTGPDELKRKLQQAEKELRTLTQLNYQLDRSQQKLVEKVNVAGMTDVIGILFRKQRSELPNLRQYNLFNKRRRAEISRIFQRGLHVFCHFLI